MTTNNHPANGPVSLDRLHQIRETLSKAAAQSDGGNLGYAMADAVQVIDGAIAAFGAEPVAWTERCEITNMLATGLYLRGFPDNSQGRDIALYTAPPAPVVPTFDEWLEIRGNKPLGWVKDAMRESYDACRSAMLQAGNSPVTLDTWIPVSERMPDNGGKSREFYLCFGTYFDGGEPDYIPASFFIHPDNGWSEWEPVEDDCDPSDVIITHWMPLPAAPQKEDL